MIKNAFYFTLKALVLNTFWPDIFSYVEKGLAKKSKFSKFMRS